MRPEETKATFTGSQALSVLLAVAALIVAAIGATIILQQWWPATHLASPICVWFSLGVVLINWHNSAIAWPQPNRIDLVGGLRIVLVAVMWPRYIGGR